MMPVQALASPRMFDGHTWHTGKALLIEHGRITSIMPTAQLPPHIPLERLAEGMLAPGFIDLQVNGGGGVQFNAAPDISSIRTIVSAHRAFGTISLLVTLITDADDVRDRAIAAAIAATEQQIPGFAGLHLEGPHLAPARKGTHEAQFMRPIEDEDIKTYAEARQNLAALLITLAPEQVAPAQLTRLVEAGVTVSLGHSNARADQIEALVEAGATMVTHLFNAQSQITVREPGLVGMGLNEGRLSAGLIADGHHVDARVMQIALRAKKGPGRIFLVTDAMAPTGTGVKSFALGERTIYRRGGRLTLEDGTLAGADLDMGEAVRRLMALTGTDPDEALRMAALYPAKAMGWTDRGHFSSGARADIVWLNDRFEPQATWIGGEKRPA